MLSHRPEIWAPPPRARLHRGDNKLNRLEGLHREKFNSRRQPPSGTNDGI